jgi:hypothetical protein
MIGDRDNGRMNIGGIGMGNVTVAGANRASASGTRWFDPGPTGEALGRGRADLEPATGAGPHLAGPLDLVQRTLCNLLVWRLYYPARPSGGASFAPSGHDRPPASFR